MFVARRSLRWLAVALTAFGLWQAGQGLYIPAKAWLAQQLMQNSWERTVGGADKAVPWPWADTWPVALLRADDDVELIVLAGASGRNLAFGPAHMSASALPGRTGNSVIAGHRDTHFEFLESLVIGDELEIEIPEGDRVSYRVTNIDIVDSRTSSIALDTEATTLSLVTCYPFDAIDAGSPLRYVVTAHGQ